MFGFWSVELAVETMDELSEVYAPPADRAGLKVLDRLDIHFRNFIALSPFYVIASASDPGAPTCGDPTGSLADVLDDKTLLLPDRPGNRQEDTLMNLVERPRVGLVFFVPGLTETLRIEARAGNSTDRALLELLAIKGMLPISVLRVTVDEAFLHCAKALIRARLRKPDERVERSRFPTHGKVLAD